MVIEISLGTLLLLGVCLFLAGMVAMFLIIASAVR
jgi:hypothetical protein